jgi:phage baseplate assembly protein W
MTAARASDIYGQGLSFPLRVGAGGRLVWSAGEDNVRESIRLILLTEPAERLMLEDFGCGLRRFLFEPNTPATRALIKERVTRAIARWEPRVRLDDVSVEADPSDDRLIQISILFRLVATNLPGRFGLSLALEG